METNDQTNAYRPRRAEPIPDSDMGEEIPARIGRYRVERLLGRGGFGQVFLAMDEALNRYVAIKVPYRSLVPDSKNAEAYLREARVVAGFDHAHIVPVFDVGSTAEYPCFIVSKYIEGSTLGAKMRSGAIGFRESAELVAIVADALHYAHVKGFVHRDVKPGNILVEVNGKPYVADFGLALSEADLGLGPTYAGTPAYMSPEQARGEGHRVDGRSDVFSLGVVLYELLAGRQPFRADTRDELFDLITTYEPRPIRQIDAQVPKELERICFKAISKRASDRYSTGHDFAEDLRAFLRENSTSSGLGPGLAVPPSHAAAGVHAGIPPSSNVMAPITPTSPVLSAEGSAIKIVPKGLRSFDARDAEFFLELLPGPRDRTGLPDSLRFWKSRIEEMDADNSFAVGLIYGPSGCGKSSLVKAGLIPSLADHVIVVYVEATAAETETRLLNGLRKQCPSLPAGLELKETLAALRRGTGLPAGKSVLIVLDQFEQWLHANRQDSELELVQALRQCDGGRLKCLAMIRDDFWMAATRFMRDIEIDLVSGHNVAAVDLFDLRHARRVLTAFGRAFGALPESTDDLSKEQHAFLNESIDGLSREGKVICVRLALFAEMMKGRPWTPASLKAVGGTEGVGATFLEEIFASSSANPKYRLHQKAARAVLKALLPEAGTDIKGHMRSTSELMQLSSYANQPRDFKELVQILDSEIRLITPTDPEGIETTDESINALDAGEKYYQLTHDYLVHSLREWLTTKQKETRRGRAELLLSDLTAGWHARQVNRQLPTWLQWLQVQFLTRRRSWSEPQRAMMRAATRYHASRGLVLAVVGLLAAIGGIVIFGMIKANTLSERLLVAQTEDAPKIIEQMHRYRYWVTPLMRQALAAAEEEGDLRKQLHASMALLPVDRVQIDYLFMRMLDARPDELPIIREAMLPYKDELQPKLWAAMERTDREHAHQRLRAAGALALYDLGEEKWSRVSDQVAADLVAVPAVYLATWVDSLRPAREMILPSLAAIYRDSKRREHERTMATDVLSDLAADKPILLAELLMDADEKQFNVLYPKLAAHGIMVLPSLDAEMTKRLPDSASNDSRELLARRQANAAVALMRLGYSTKVWPAFEHRPDPRLRTYLIHRLSACGVDPRQLVKRALDESVLSIRRALVLALGEYSKTDLPVVERELWLDHLRHAFQNESDAGLRSAAEWHLRQWNEGAWLNQAMSVFSRDAGFRDKKTEQVRRTVAAGQTGTQPQWYVNKVGDTMIVFAGPIEFRMGSPGDEAGREPGEALHGRRVERSFALASKPVSLAQFTRFQAKHDFPPHYAPTHDCPALRVSWYLAAEYCNWLSKQEGLPESEWCYLSNASGKYAEGMKLAPNYLQRTGYRLPTDAEWEYACRAGAITSRHYGCCEELLGKYAWYMNVSDHRSHPVGNLKPNDSGLFDILGNVYTWCQDRQKDFVVSDKPIVDVEEPVEVLDKDARILRGGSFADAPAVELRCAFRVAANPTLLNPYAGFRVARTFPTR